MSDIEKQLRALRQNLLDLTMRNRLLNFKPTKARTIRVMDEIPTEVYNMLVLSERTMQFLPRPKPRVTGHADEGNSFEGLEKDTSGLTEEETSILWELPQPDSEVADRHVDRYLQTSLERDALQKRLFYVSQQAHSVLEEQGYTVLYLSLGFLEWTESPSALQPRLAPLVLVPVDLERTKVGKSFSLRWTGEDILTNISLQAKLVEQGVTLPDFEMPEDKSGIDQYFQSVVEAISILRSWQVVQDIYLGFFSFTKFIMYKDLDPKSWPAGMSPTDHPLIQAILNPSDDATSEPGFSESEVDEKLTPRDLYHLMDADPSQIAVIEDAKGGRNLVVEGPPGTGKSQTIVNLIAELLASGKSVVFVSEKMAALEVVKSRLDGVGLGDFCLELHSRKSKKKEVLKELERSIHAQPLASISVDEEAGQLEALKSDLNGYAKALREPFGKFGRSPFALFCMKESAKRHFKKVGRDMPLVTFATPENYGQQEWAETMSSITNLAEVVPLVKPIASHPWRGCEPGTVLPAEEAEIKTLIEGCQASIENLEATLDHMVTVCGVKRHDTPQDIPHAVSAAKIVAESKPIDKKVLLNEEWNKPSQEAERIIDNIESFHTELPKALSNFDESALDEDIFAILDEYKVLSQKFFRWFTKRYRHLKRDIYALYSKQHCRKIKQIIVDLEQLAQCSKLRDGIRQKDRIGKNLFGSHWQAERSDASVLRSFAEWIVAFRRQLIGDILTEHSAVVISEGVSREQVVEATKQVDEAAKKFFAQRNLLADRICPNYENIFGRQAESVSFPDLSSRLKLWKTELPRLQRWAQFVALRNACLNTAARPVVEMIDADAVEPEDIIPCFEANFADSLLRLAFTERPVLSSFIGEVHKKKIERFANLDRELITLNCQRLAYKLHQERPVVSGGASSGSEAGILLGEFGRKRGHMPIRKLMTLAGGLIQKIKPCFMMSPLSIAQFFDPRSARFDVIVFDEASQVRPEDALGALLRGNQVIVMGDTRQLPPTTFFDHIIESVDDTDLDSSAPVADVESILHQCKRCFPTKILSWHYHSRHESLIAVSNQEFYDNRLLVYPSPIAQSEHLGLEFVHLPDAIYDRGRSSINRKEARTVAKAALEHYRLYPHKSLGVGAFNIKQQQGILEEVELQLRHNPEMQDFFSSSVHEHFFVKNLETIQGDERDVIFLSIGFGFDESGRLTLHFGPLNHEGGERRLNVLISRARQRCVVFSNFRAQDLPLDGTAPFGLRALKVFLDYAENRNLRSIEITRRDVDSPFEESVYDFLQNSGCEVRKQVGCAGFRIDLAIVHTAAPGRYLLGIECDGAKYHSSRVARDRDRLRQQILEGLGWRIHRVWSTDWYRNRGECEERLLEAVKKAKDEPNTQVDTRPNPSLQTTVVTHDKDTPQKDEYRNTFAVQDALENEVADYEICSSLGIFPNGELHEVPTHLLAKAVVQVVNVEAPIHFDEVVRRIRSLWGLKRTGHRIVDAIKKATLLAKQNGQVSSRGRFLWPIGDRPVSVRRRSGDPPPKIELICDEEIGQAIKLVLKYQYATMPDDLVLKSSRLLGIQATRGTTARRIMAVIQRLIDEGQLQKMPNRMVDFVKS